MKYTIPVRNTTDTYLFAVELSGKVFDMRLHYNQRESHWYLDVARNGDDIVQGIKLVHTDDLLSQFRAYEIPEGKLIVHDITGAYRDPDADNFGETVLLQYED